MAPCTTRPALCGEPDDVPSVVRSGDRVASGARSVSLPSAARRRTRRVRRQGVHHACGVHERGAGIDGDGNAQRFHDLFVGCAVLQRRMHMGGDASVTLAGHSHRQRDQFPVLASRCAVFVPASLSSR